MNNTVLFIMPDEREVYKNTNVKMGAFHLPSLAFAILGAITKQNGFHPLVLDLGIHDSPEKMLERSIAENLPVYCGITCTSATYHQAIKIATNIKSRLP